MNRVENRVENAMTPCNIKSIVLQIPSENSKFENVEIDEFLISILMKKFSLETWKELHEISSFVKIYELSLSRYTCPIMKKFSSTSYKNALVKQREQEEEYISSKQLFQLTPKSKVSLISTRYHAIIILDINRSISTVGENVLLDVLFVKLHEFWTVACRLSSFLNIKICITILLELGANHDFPVYHCFYDAPTLSDFSLIFEKLKTYTNQSALSGPPSDFYTILSNALHCSQFQKGSTTFLLVLTSGVVDVLFPPNDGSPIRKFVQLNVPIFIFLLTTRVSCFGAISDVEILKYLASATGGQCSCNMDLCLPFFVNYSYIRTNERFFSSDIFPLSNKQMAFPWEKDVVMPTVFAPTRYREYEVIYPMEIIKARLRQGFMVYDIHIKSKITLHLIHRYFPEVCIHYKLKILSDWSMARVEILVLAFSEFIMNIFTLPSYVLNTKEESVFIVFLRTLVDKDLAYNKLAGMRNKLSVATTALTACKVIDSQVVEKLLLSHTDWMDQDFLYFCCSKETVIHVLETWSKCIISNYYIHFDSEAATFGFTGILIIESTDNYVFCQVLFYKLKNLPTDFNRLPTYNGGLSVMHGPYTELNLILLKHTSYVYLVPSHLCEKMGSVSMEYFLNLKYQLLQSSLSLVYLVKQDLQITVSFNKASFSIDIYQLPRVHCTNIDDLLHKLSAIYTLDTLLSKVFCSSHPLFSIRHLLKHSNLTVIGFHNQINVPARAFTKALYCHVKTRSIDLQFEYVQECEEFHNLIHQWHGFTPPLCSQFEGCVYISHDSVFLFYLPRQTNIPYILLFECIRNQFNEQNRVPMELSPHCLRPTQKVYPLISIYYYTDCHVKTESIDLILSKCAWQSTVECVYSLSKQLHFSNVDLCIQHLDTWMVKLDISLMICLFEVLHLDQMRNFEYIHSECTRFNKCVQKFIRVIPNTHYFTASVPFVFVSISSFQSLPQACKKKLTSCPTSAPLENVVYNEQQMQRMLKDYIYPYPIELHISYYGLEEDKSQVSTFVNSMKESFESVIKEITLNLFLAITPITNRMLDIILNDLNVLNKTEFLLSVLKSATISLIQSELERFEINGFTITRVDSYFLLFSESNSMSMNVLQTASELFMVSENEENPAMAFELNYNNNHVKKTPALRKGVSQKKRAWIILTVKPEALCVYSNVPHLRSIIGSMLPNLQRMINTRVLLNQLKDTHSSSRYLIPIHETVNSEEPHHCFNSLTKEDEEIMNASDGEFDCPVQFTTSFPLHWRLKFMEALKKVSASLDSLAVTNRAYTFVMVSPEGHVYYMILKEIGSCNLSLHFASNTTVNTECTTDSASFKTHTTTTNSSVSMSYTPTLRQLVIELYGLDPLSERFSNEVITMISSRLSKVVLHHLSIYLSRTDICKLTFPDVQFLFPIYCGPKVTYLISDVPLSSLDETSILFFRQSLLLFLSVLCSNDVIVTIQQHLQLKYNLFFTGNDECKVSPFDMIFSYCSISAHTTPNASESTLGSGIGCILFYVLQKNKICLQPTLEAPIYWCVEMWTHGILNTQALFEKIQHCQLQACHDAEVENDFKVNTSLTNLLLKLCQAPTDYYTCLNVHRWPIRIASWHTTHLMEYLETTLPDLPFQRGFNSCYCLSSCSELQNMCYYSNFVHSWSMNKWIKKKVDRHFLFFVEIQKEDILCVCWNISAVMLEKIQAGLKAYVEKYAQYIKELQQVTLFKMGLRREIPSWYLTAMSNRKLCFQKWCPSPSLFSSVVPFNQVYHPHLEHKERDLRVTVTLLGNEDPLPSSICPKSKKPYLTNAELHRLLSQSSLVYSYRSPIFFHCTYHSSSFSFKGVELLSSFDFLKASMSTLLKELMNEFCAHLHSLGFELVCTKQDHSLFTFTQDSSLPVPGMYFQKEALGGCTLVEATFDRFFFCVLMYQYVFPPIFMPSPPSHGDSHSFQNLCFTLRQRLQVAAFVYDFQIRYLAHVILTSVQVPFPLFQVLCELHQFKYPKEVTRQVFRNMVPYPHAPTVSYILSYPLRFGLGLLGTQNNVCYFTLTDTFPTSIVVIRQIPQGIDYFQVLTPTSLTHASVPKTGVADPPPWSDPSTFIQELLKKAKRYYEREQRWQRLLETHPCPLSEVLEVARTFYFTSLLTLDPKIQLLLRLPAEWQEVSRLLSASWPYGHKIMPGIRPDLTYFFMLYNQDDSAFYIVSFSPPHVTVVIRDEEDKKQLRSLTQFFVLTFSRMVWQHLNCVVAS